MKAINAILTIVVAVLLSGCMNLYTRCPGTKPVITDTYQCTQASAGIAFVVMFPQVMMPSGGNKPLLPENLISIPIGCLCFVDVAAEGVLDTVLWPFDYMISKSDNNKRNSTETIYHESNSGKGR